MPFLLSFATSVWRRKRNTKGRVPRRIEKDQLSHHVTAIVAACLRGGPCGGRRGHSYVGAPFPALLRPLPRRAMETTLRQGVRLCPYLSRVVSSGVSASSVGVQHLVHKASMCPVMAGSLNEVHAAVSSPASVMQKAGLSTSRPRARPASRAPASTPTFDYERFYKEQVDLKHRDKRCVFPVTLLLSCFAVNFFCQSVACVLFCFFLLFSEHFPISSFSTQFLRLCRHNSRRNCFLFP